MVLIISPSPAHAGFSVSKNQGQGPGARDRVLNHYLRGLLFCDQCYRKGRTSTRLVYTEANGRGGTYGYFVCRGRQEGVCDLPYLPAGQVEHAVANYYDTIRLPEGFATSVEHQAQEALAYRQRDVHDRQKLARKRLLEVDQQEERLLDLVADGALATDKLRTRLQKLAVERIRLQNERQETGETLTKALELVGMVLDLLKNPHLMYERATDATRRPMNDAFFHALYLSRDVVELGELTQVFREFVDAYPHFQAAQHSDSQPRNHLKNEDGHPGQVTEMPNNKP